MDPRRLRSFNKIEDTCLRYNVRPLFTIKDYQGLTTKYNGRTSNKYYPVVCTECGTEFMSWFKLSDKPRMCKCPVCNEGHKNTDITYDQVLCECLDSNIRLLCNHQDWKGRSHTYQVECLKCGLKFTTSLRKNHFSNCPYCYPSSNQDNQIAKLQKICEDNHLQLLSTTYSGKQKYQVKCLICDTEYLAMFNGHTVTNCLSCCERKQRLNRERLISKLLDDHNVTHYNNYRSHGMTMNDKAFELDIFIPDYNIAFEFNGQAFHNSGSGLYSKDKNYHKLKTEICLNNNIRLYHFWDNIPDRLCKSVILSKLNLTNKIYARSCILTEVTSQVAKQFLSRCHIDGFVRSSKYFALVHYNKVVALLTLLNRSIQSTKESAWEIGRFASELNTTVVGGYSKLLKHSINYLQSIGIHELISYCNRDISPDPYNTFYYKYGFEYLGDSGQICWYWSSKTVEYNGKTYKHGCGYSRQQFQKE